MLLLEIARYVQGALGSSDLLVEPEGDPDVPFGPETLLEQRIRSLENGKQHSFHVERSAAVDPTVGHRPGEGRVVPARQGRIGRRRIVVHHRDHVVVRTEENRPERRIPAAPMQQQPVAIDRHRIQVLVNLGIRRRKIGLERIERVVLPRVDRLADSRDTDPSRQTFDRTVGGADRIGRPVGSGELGERVGRRADNGGQTDRQQGRRSGSGEYADDFLPFFHGSVRWIVFPFHSNKPANFDTNAQSDPQAARLNRDSTGRFSSRGKPACVFTDHLTITFTDRLFPPASTTVSV